MKPLIASLHDDESEVRRAAFEALKRLKTSLGGMDIRKALDEYASRDSWVEDVAEEIRAMYAKRPEGFYRGFGWPEEKRLREIGQMLHDKRGINLMRKIHSEFASRSIPIGAARNLESMWDGIGAWKG